MCAANLSSSVLTCRISHAHLSDDTHLLQVVDGAMTQAAYIKAFPDLAGSAPNVSKKLKKFHQVGHNG